MSTYENQSKFDENLFKLAEIISEYQKINRVKKIPRKGYKCTGFIKICPVPRILTKFLGLEEGIKLSKVCVNNDLLITFHQIGVFDGMHFNLTKQVIQELELDEKYIDTVKNLNGFNTLFNALYEEPMVPIQISSYIFFYTGNFYDHIKYTSI
jgi:hypothetical protein